MIDVARRRAARDGISATFRVEDLGEPLRFADASLDGVLAILVVQHLADPATFLAEIRRCLRPGGHLLVRAPVRNGMTGPDSPASASSSPVPRRTLSWRLRAACYTHVPGVVRFFDVDALQRLVEGQGFTVVHRLSSGTSVTILARAELAPLPAPRSQGSRAAGRRDAGAVLPMPGPVLAARDPHAEREPPSAP
jgi:SAM-dependent methyltransferase